MLETLANKMTLAEGVLDGTEKSLSEAKLKRGSEANIARLQQILSIAPRRPTRTLGPASSKPTSPKKRFPTNKPLKMPSPKRWLSKVSRLSQPGAKPPHPTGTVGTHLAELT